MCVHVMLQRVRTGQLLAAHRTLLWPDPRVHLHVPRQHVVHGERLQAQLTLERPGRCVDDLYVSL